MIRHYTKKPTYRLTQSGLHLDFPLLILIILLLTAGLFILYSASSQNTAMVIRQGLRLSLALVIMLVFSFIPPHKYKYWTPWIYGIGLGLLIAVMLIGKVGKGAQRWLEFGFFRFQPSEIMKLAIPMMTAWYLDKKPFPIDTLTFIKASLIIFIPALLIAKQPDLGTAIMVSIGGLCAIFVAGLRFKLIFGLIGLFALSGPLLWTMLHDYQKKRILTLLHPENDPLGAGYHIIQSKIAIGSGGLLGKGWLCGSQAHLNFLPEHATDFIFAVSSEELGFIGGLGLMLLILLITLRSLHIANEAQTPYTRLLAIALATTYFFSAFVNMGMVMGILPVVGIPLPLISYGGTAMVTFLASFGLLMSIHSHKILFNTFKGRI